MTNNSKKSGFGWFTSNSSDKDTIKQDYVNYEEEDTIKEEVLDSMNEFEEKKLQDSSALLSKDNQDKVVRDLIVSIENIIKDRKLISFKNKDIDNQLLVANVTIGNLKQDLANNTQLLHEKNKQIVDLEDTVTYKQMNYDQLLEDYKEYQTTSNSKYQNISMQLDTEINKYHKLNEEFTNSQHHNILINNKLDEKIRILEIENEQYQKNYRKVLDEKAELMTTINDFTDRMSFSFSPKTHSNPPDAE